jgi:enamine deaminase RidA (YjgF/YER057c/UK114 family)
MNIDQAFHTAAKSMGLSFDGDIKIGGNYVPLKRDGSTIYISGQIPRVQDTVMVVGRVGATVDLDQARLAAQICVMRALALLQRECGSLAQVQAVLQITVYVQCAEGFTLQSEVADAASDLLVQVLGAAGTHARTSVGVYQLPKNASVELDMVVKTSMGSQSC